MTESGEKGGSRSEFWTYVQVFFLRFQIILQRYVYIYIYEYEVEEKQ